MLKMLYMLLTLALAALASPEPGGAGTVPVFRNFTSAYTVIHPRDPSSPSRLCGTVLVSGYGVADSFVHLFTRVLSGKVLSMVSKCTWHRCRVPLPLSPLHLSLNHVQNARWVWGGGVGGGA